MGNQLTDAAQMLDLLDESAGQDSGAAKRKATRRTWRKPLKVTITHPGGKDQRIVAVVTRNLSSGGMTFLHNGFLNPGTQCETQLVIADDARVDVQGTVLRCRYITGRIHEVSLQFDKPVDILQVASQKLSARSSRR